jgi:hypothetical protein
LMAMVAKTRKRSSCGGESDQAHGLVFLGLWEGISGVLERLCLLIQPHSLKSAKFVGEHLRHLAQVNGPWVVLLLWSSSGGRLAPEGAMDWILGGAEAAACGAGGEQQLLKEVRPS